MGHLRDWSPEPNGNVLAERLSSSSSSSASSLPSLLASNERATEAEYWRRAEEATQGIIALVQPTVDSENRRKAVIDYVQRLIRGCLGCEVIPIGSVPLKTYLPDGDIDLTAFGGLNIEEALATNVCSILEREDQNSAAQFIVKDVQLIRAEVKIVKCLVQDIVVDISFNQLGGLCTLCFLEQVNHLIGKDHLFKRSIILIKAWCYYESRILGAHHGLISTYALETLVLYIFHLFHTSLNGPLAVLYKFLEHFSKFDWDNYCISLHGPVCICSLPEIVVETPENDGRDLLLSNDFLQYCVEKYSVPSRGYGTDSRTFNPKHLNIVDPLKENNNLGRSVSKGNFYRIRSAFTYGARKLGHILSQPEENLDDEINKFFSNTLDRHGSGQRPDVQDPALVYWNDGFHVRRFSGTVSQAHMTYESESGISSGFSGECRLDPEGSLCDGFHKVEISDKESVSGRALNEPATSMKVPPIAGMSEVDSSTNVTLSQYRIFGDAKDLATSRIQSLDVLPISSSNDDDSFFPLGTPRHAPNLYLSHISSGEIRNASSDTHSENSGFINLPSRVLPLYEEQTGLRINYDPNESQWGNYCESLYLVGSNHYLSQSNLFSCSSEDMYQGNSCYHALDSSARSADGPKYLSDLSGDHERNISSLSYGRLCYEYANGAALADLPSILHAQIPSKKSWDVITQSMQHNRNVFSEFNPYGVVPRPFYPCNLPLLPGVIPFCMEEMHKRRGTGTYIPNMNHYKDKHLTTRGKYHAAVRLQRGSGHFMSHVENRFPKRVSRELASSHHPSPHQHGGRLESQDHSFGSRFSPHQGGGRSESLYHPFCLLVNKAFPNANGSVPLSERAAEFGSVGNFSVDVPIVESGRKPGTSSSITANPIAGNSSPHRPEPKSLFAADQDRIAAKSYQLKDEGDFPPLSI